MNDEEKKAIEYWKRDIALYHYNTQLCSEHYAQIILNLIKKQEKVIDRTVGMLVVKSIANGNTHCPYDTKHNCKLNENGYRKFDICTNHIKEIYYSEVENNE